MKLDLSDLTPQQKSEAKALAGEIIVDEMQDYLDRGLSPVKGKGKFKRLSKKYADEFKGGNRDPDLFLEGDMRSQITFEDHAQGVKVGIFSDAPTLDKLKASGHNLGNSANKTQRQFVPFPKGDFKKTIMDKVNKGIDSIRTSSSDLFEPTDSFLDDIIDGEG